MQTTEQDRTRWALPFFTIWSGQAISQLGSRMAAFALVWWMTETTGSATILATGSLLIYLPEILIGPFVGALVDRWNRRTVMMVSDTLIALTTACLAFLFWRGSIQVWHVFTAILISSFGGTFQGYAMMTSTSLMVPEEHLSRVQGANQILQGALAIGGPPLGALLLAVLPIYTIMGIDVVTAAFAIVPLFFTFIPKPPQEEGTKTSILPSLLADIRAGVRYLWNWPGLMGIILIGALVNFTLAPTRILLPLLVTDHFGGGAIQLGWLQAASGVGLISGGVILSTWGGFRRRILTSLLGIVIAGLATVIIGIAPKEAFWLALAGMCIAGVTSALVEGPLMAVMQAKVAPEVQGRVFTVFGSGVQATVILGLLIVGPVSDLLGVRFWFIVGGVLTMLVVPIAFFIPTIVNIEDQKQRPPSTEEIGEV